MLVVFAVAVDAARCAVENQRGMSDKNHQILFAPSAFVVGGIGT